MQLTELTGFGLGLRVSGFWPGFPHLPETDLRRLLHRHGLLLFDGISLDEDAFTALARRFGEPEIVHPAVYRARSHSHIRVQSNVPGLGINYGGTYWHSDGPWNEVPTAATLLFCVEAPTTGGETLFIDMRAVLDDLPTELRQLIEGRCGWYPCRRIYQRELQALDLEDPEKLNQLRDLSHPLVRSHPVTGREALYLNEQWMEGIEGMSERDGNALLSALYESATDGRYLYRHRWSAGDVLVWDNASTMHQALFTETGRKVMWRITIDGTSWCSNQAAREEGAR